MIEGFVDGTCWIDYSHFAMEFNMVNQSIFLESFMKTLILATLLGSVVMLSGCFGGARSPVGLGGLYTGVQGSETISSNAVVTKHGESCAMNVLGVVAVGDASIKTAASTSGITKIAHVDYDTTTVWFLFAKSCTEVYGE